VRKGDIAADKALHNDNGTQIDEMSTNSTDRPFAPGDLQRSVETYTGNNRNIRR